MTTKTTAQADEARISPVYLSALFAEGADFHVFLQLKANNASDLEISVIHNAVTGVKVHDLAGDGEINLSVQNGECLAIIAYYHGDVVGSGIYLVDTSLIEELGKLLLQCTVHDIYVDQDDFIVVERAAARALNEVCPASTGQLVAAAEVR
jgi:hypothetical protein